jgi:predicted alpha/beta-hydrolase family hydrolase
MSDSAPFLSLNLPCSQALDWVDAQLNAAGMQTAHTFDLQVARQAQTSCPCPQHGIQDCDCQMVVTLVYAVGSGPLALTAHGYGNQTWFSVVDRAGQRADADLEQAVRLALSYPTATTTG